ncbi:TPA: DUF4113 domain-containing protein [Serratia marcescens]
MFSVFQADPSKAWAMRRELLSPRYTTRLSDIPNARLI